MEPHTAQLPAKVLPAKVLPKCSEKHLDVECLCVMEPKPPVYVPS